MIACPDCGGDAPDTDTGGSACVSCGWRDDRCDECGAIMAFDPLARGTTCGGLDIVGALVCCGRSFVCRLSKPADALDWRLAKGGRSMTAGGIKVRADSGSAEEVETLMKQIVSLPALEIEVTRLRRIVERKQP